MADHALTQDDIEEIVQRFNRAIETKLRPIVREMFQKYQGRKGKAVSPTDLRKRILHLPVCEVWPSTSCIF